MNFKQLFRKNKYELVKIIFDNNDRKKYYKIKSNLLISELIEFIITTPVDDPVIFKSKLIKKVRGMKNEIEKLGC